MREDESISLSERKARSNDRRGRTIMREKNSTLKDDLRIRRGRAEECPRKRPELGHSTAVSSGFRGRKAAKRKNVLRSLNG